MQLINTIEINPYDYTDNELTLPDGHPLEFPERWNAYWHSAISEAGLGTLKAIRKGSYLVAMESIEDHELELILKQKLKEIDLPEFEDQLGCLGGGIVLEENDRFLIEPMCCGDIGNIKNWAELFGNDTNDWTALWIGHPQVFYRISDGIVEFSDYTDLNAEDLTEHSGVMKLSEIELKTELQKAINQQDAFRARISHCLTIMGMEHAERMAALMTGNG